MSTELKAAVAELLQGSDVMDGFLETNVPGLTVMRSSTETLPQHMLYRPALCLIVQGAKEMSVGNVTLAYREGQSLIVSMDVPGLGRITQASPERPYIALILELEITAMREVIEQLTTPPYAGGDHGFGLFVEETGGPIVECVLRLIRLVDRPDGLPILYSSIMREIFYWLLTGPNGNKIARLAITSTPAERITNAIHFIRESFALPISIEQLAEVANMSPSSFHQHFKSLTSMTPLQYQKQLRLIEARRLLAQAGTNVADAAFKVGYESASQFSREYSRMFGLPPARDASQMPHAFHTAA